MKNNVLLIGVVEKCHPDETRMKCHIQEKLKANEFAEALRIANEGLHLGKSHVHHTCTAADAEQEFSLIHAFLGSKEKHTALIKSLQRGTLLSLQPHFYALHTALAVAQ